MSVPKSISICTAAWLVCGRIPVPRATGSHRAAGAFATRGYYITFMRMPTFGLKEWTHTLDLMREDRCNVLILWMAGGFRSRKFPVTWRYNSAHKNVQHDFARTLIERAHQRGIRVLLGFTPFGYDGVNQMPLERPELAATGPDGKRAARFGIHSWGYNLCPSQPEAQRFMREYVREMLWDFYPNADGLMIESSDYAICHCARCGPRFFDREYAFVEDISREIWARKPGATVVVYPHYFTGRPVPGFGVSGAKRAFDSRWTLFFTPHSAYLDPDLIRRARGSIYSDDSPALKEPRAIRSAIRRAKDSGANGYAPSLEAFSYVATEPEEGQAWLVGRRQVPMGFGWLPPERMPYDELPARVNRTACRLFTENPDLSWDAFRERLPRELFGPGASPGAADDALRLQSMLALERTWRLPSPLASPRRVRAMAESGSLTPERRARYRTELASARRMAQKYQGARGREAEIGKIAAWIVGQWNGENARLLEDPSSMRQRTCLPARLVRMITSIFE